MPDFNDYWYTVDLPNGSVLETSDWEIAKDAILDERDVHKTTRRVFESGDATVQINLIVEIKYIQDL